MMERDLIDDLYDEIDRLDEIDLDIEDKVAFSKEVRDAIREEIGKIPMGKIITKILEKEVEKRKAESEKLNESIEKTKTGIENDLKKTRIELKKDIEDLTEKLRKKHAELKNDILSQPKYQFGGFSPQFNDLNIGDPSVEGAWRIVKSGNDLNFERYESGVWTVKLAATP